MNRLIKIYLFFLTLSFLYPIILFVIARNYFGSGNLLMLPGMISHAKYTETWEPPSFLIFFMMSIFISAIIAGFLSGSEKSNMKRKMIFYAWTVPVIISSHLNAARSAMALPIVFWLASYISGRAFMGSEKRMKIKNVLFATTVIILLAFIIVHTGYMVRSNVLDFDESRLFLGKSVSTLAGHMSVLEDWIQRGGLWSSQHKTIYTFAGTAQLFGIGERISGLYDENVTINYGGELSESNIYTAFRPLIDDFGITGAFFGVGFLSIITSVSWFYLKSGSIWGYPLVLIFNSFVLWSPITCIYTYNVTIGAVIISSFFIIFELHGKKIFQPRNYDSKTENMHS